MSKSILGWTARIAALAAVAVAGFGTVTPAVAEPLFPGGPDVPGVPAIVPTASPCPVVEARACLRLSTNEAWLVDNGRVIFGPTPISHGMAGYETPPAVTKISFKREFHWSTMHNAPMRWATFFNGDMAFHVGPVDSKSHGCVRMTEDGAHRFFDYLKPGDITQVIA
ncbi:L,D-transpeptidase [Nocardia sp. XZ_19_231]|uniref:L,D-transpeptidase n=1 Tax=Nocardia sp. XZ_19_231 TaxID=2769252 RepID=UPI00188EC550|nr:L,D-transpeptidase [Nocardia sp. XZ_19_231]